MQQKQESCTIEEALGWILGILNEQQIPYQIVGGTAAHIYGGSRPIADIDMYIPKERAAALASRLESFISKPLKHYLEDVWDIEYFQIIYKGQKLEFGVSPGTKIFDREATCWVEQVINFEDSVSRVFCGIEVNLMPIADLIGYKSLLDRDVDRIDVSELGKLIKNQRLSDSRRRREPRLLNARIFTKRP
jgi:hypothetical protein